MSDDGKPIHLYMSGGGHRAGFGCIGVILALVHYGRWQRVTRVISVSGGSMINGALVANRATDDESTQRAMATMWRQMTHHGIKPWSTAPRRRGMAGAAALVGATAFGIRSLCGSSRRLNGRAGRATGFASGLVIQPLVVTAGRRIVSVYFREFLAGSLEPAGEDGITRLSQAEALPRQHIICATGRATSVPYYFVAGPGHEEFAWGTELRDGYSVVDAAWASSSLPGLETVRGPASSEFEILVDGGASGMFGEQVNSRLERSAGTALSGAAAVAPDQPRTDLDSIALVVDAGSHAKPPSRLLRRLGPLSMIYVLGRWVKAAMEATFVNDLHDFQGNHQIHITESGRVWRRSPTPKLGPTIKSPSVIVANEDGTISRLHTDPEILEAVNRGRSETRGLGLLGVTRSSSLAPIVVGFVATALEFNPSLTVDELDDALRVAGEKLGAGNALVDKWQALLAV